MLNISEVSTNGKIDPKQYKAFSQMELSPANKMLKRWLVAALLIFLVIIFLPWTQNIQSKGKVTTLKPEHRPQTIHSTIAGRIEKWYVQEGQLVNAGDTIVFISEIKTEYFDPNLVNRTNDQINAKEDAIQSYDSKVQALEDQIAALRSEFDLKQQQLTNKIQQARLKITSDSIDLERAKIDYDIAIRQLNRTQELYDQGIRSLTEFEDKKVKAQESNAKLVAAENKFLISRNELANAQLEFNTARFEYSQKIAKAESDKFSTLSQLFDTEANVSKLRIESSNYLARSSFYFITAPQDCYITKAMVTGVGETVKEGDAVVSIMPADFELAVELYIQPMDLPLIQPNSKVNFIFDGWPALVFTGWPDLSFGFFQGRVAAIDNTISENGKYRILIKPDPDEKPWPVALRPGSGAEGIALLNNVPVWYELWRRLNGFPPDFYETDAAPDPKLKVPVKSIPK